MNEYKSWEHVFKLDPNKEINDQDLERLCESGTDAIIVGGSDGVTLDNTLNLLSRIRQYALDCALEISTLDAVTPGFDTYFIPTVLNSEKTEWIVKHHHEAVKQFGETINWDDVAVEGYCVLNPEAKVARLTEANTNLELDDIQAFAMMAERMFHLPIFYLEYSGTYGDPTIVQKVKETLTETQLFYGGGITSPEKAKEMACYADTIVVGNIIYDDMKAALKTVGAVKKIKSETN